MGDKEEQFRMYDGAPFNTEMSALGYVMEDLLLKILEELKKLNKGKRQMKQMDKHSLRYYGQPKAVNIWKGNKTIITQLDKQEAVELARFLLNAVADAEIHRIFLTTFYTKKSKKDGKIPMTLTGRPTVKEKSKSEKG